MVKFNLIVIFNETKNKVLLCKRMKEPFLGKYNFPGGKVEAGETLLAAAKRECFEETGLQLPLKRLMQISYYVTYPFSLHVYYGVSKSMRFVEENNPLQWFDIDTDFAGPSFAGYGNVKHIINIALNEINREAV